MFSTLSKTEITVLSKFNLSSANPLNLVQSKNLSFGKISNNVFTFIPSRHNPSRYHQKEFTMDGFENICIKIHIKHKISKGTVAKEEIASLRSILPVFSLFVICYPQKKHMCKDENLL